MTQQLCKLVFILSIISTSVILYAAWSGNGHPHLRNVSSKSSAEGTRKRNTSVHILKEQLYQDLIPYVKLISQTESKLPSNVPVPIGAVKYEMLNASSGKFMDQIKEIDSIKTVIFKIPKSTFIKILSPRVYAIHANDCKKAMTFSYQYRSHLDQYDLPCQDGNSYRYINMHVNNTFGMTKSYDYQHGINNVNNDGYQKVAYMNIIRDGYVQRVGDCYFGNHHLAIARCNNNRFLKSGDIMHNKSDFHPRVLSIWQFWGVGYFHFSIEDLPRIAFALPFLLANPDVKVHVESRNGIVKCFLNDLGIDSERIVSNLAHGKTVYLPGGTRCVYAAIFPLSAMSIILRSKLDQEHQRDTIVLIRPLARRWFNNHDAILDMIQIAATKFQLKVAVFGDKPVIMSHDATRHLFNRAVMVVGPHDAGLSNVIFSQPGICVVEGLSKSAPACYRHLSQILGHVYHVVISDTGDCLDTRPNELSPAVYQCLHWIQKEGVF